MEYLMFYGTLFLLGMAHGLEPGHGKLLVTSYLAGTHAKVKDVVLLGLLVTFFHTMSVGLLGTVVVFLAYKFFPAKFVSSAEVMAGLVILGLGSMLFWRRFIQKTPHEHQCDCHIMHEESTDTEVLARPHSSLKEVMMLGFASGVTPCPVALAALVGAFSMGEPVAALFALAIFSAGMGVVLLIIGIGMLKCGNALALRYTGWAKAPVLIAKVSTIAVLLLGVYLVAKPFYFSKGDHEVESPLHLVMPKKAHS